MRFLNRVHAGRKLAELLRQRGLAAEDAVVLGLPRGGVPVAYEVAIALDFPLDVIIVRKLGAPQQRELAMGAIGEDGVRTMNEDVVAMTGVSSGDLAAIEKRERAELKRRAERFRGGQPRIPLTGRTALIVDDGIATGSTARAACRVARAHGAMRVVLAAPVAPPSTLYELRGDADDIVCVETPEPFWAIGEFYDDFTPTSDDEVNRLLDEAADRTGVATTGVDGDRATRDEDVAVTIGSVRLAGHITIPERPLGIVVFAHGSGSSRRSPRNRLVAGMLNQAGLGTLLFDLLTPEEERDRTNVFDIPMLGTRLAQVTEWLRASLGAEDIPVGYFGASTGAGAALWAAAGSTASIAAVVSRGGRPDLAVSRLPDVKAPTLLIVGGRDEVVIELNREAQQQLQCENRLEIVSGATHLFEEPGALEKVAALARGWFLNHLVAAPRPHPEFTRDAIERDPYLEHAREEAEGTEVYQDPVPGGALEVEREEAQGVEVFSDPDATLPARALQEGSSGHESFTGDNLGLEPNGEEERDR